MNICFDCSSGVSGDMIVGALLDLGADKNALIEAIESLKLTNYKIKIEKINKKGTPSTNFDVELKNNADHDMNVLFGSGKFAAIKEKRTLKDVKILLNNSTLPNPVKQNAIKIFELIARAEGKAHSIPASEVIFHENGAMDSIIDIVSICFCLHNLGVEKVFVKNLCEGSGKIKTRVGWLPIPTPAVKNIVDEYNIILEQANVDVELITPTGLAALAIVSKFEQPTNEQVINIGFGAGKRDYNLPCTLKVEEII